MDHDALTTSIIPKKQGLKEIINITKTSNTMKKFKDI